jgi:hypothetical protein
VHPLQHLRVDVPNRRRHACFAQLRRRFREVQRLQCVHPAVPDRRDRSLARRRALPARLESESLVF